MRMAGRKIQSRHVNMVRVTRTASHLTNGCARRPKPAGRMSERMSAPSLAWHRSACAHKHSASARRKVVARVGPHTKSDPLPNDQRRPAAMAKSAAPSAPRVPGYGRISRFGILKAYNSTAFVTGKGQTIAILIDTFSGRLRRDLKAFWKLNGLAIPPSSSR